MLRRLQPFFVLGLWVVAFPAAAQESSDDPTAGDQQSAEGDTAPAASEAPAAEEPTAEDQSSAEADAKADASIGTQSKLDLSAKLGAGTEASASPPAIPEVQSSEPTEPWHTEIHGYFRAPFTMGISSRPNPETKDAATNTFTGPDQLQISYGPTRTVDANYYSFAYTRLQEQDWAELYIHAKKKHVDAAIGWMGYWFQGAGFRNADAAWVPGNAYLTLDTDFDVANVKPNIALTVGAWWPHFGYFEKYDTYTLGQFRQVGEQLRLTVPINPDLKVTAVQGFGTSRDGSFSINFPAPYQGQVGLDLIHYENVSVSYKKYVDIGIHYNNEWSRDPFLWQSGVEGKNYTDVRNAHLSVVGGEATFTVPYAGRLWISPSYIVVKNGWALDWAGTEVMHSIGGMGIATNYMGWTNNPPDSTGSGKMLNLGFLYQNTLSNIQGREPPAHAPEVTLNAFGLLANASIDLPAGSTLTQDKIKQFKWGADVTIQALDWLGFMGRYDEVNYDLDHGGYVFSAITPRIIFSSHFLSSESIYVQYSRYRYGDNMTLAGKWPWGQQLVAGSDITQGSPYTGFKPDMDVVKVQANVAF